MVLLVQENASSSQSDNHRLPLFSFIRSPEVLLQGFFCWESVISHAQKPLFFVHEKKNVHKKSVKRVDVLCLNWVVLTRYFCWMLALAKLQLLKLFGYSIFSLKF